MSLCGIMVSQRENIYVNSTFADRLIVSLDENYLFVRFKDRESKFLYPSAFENGYLSR